MPEKLFDDLAYLDQLNPNYKDVRSLMDEAKFKGTDFVLFQPKRYPNDYSCSFTRRFIRL